MLQAAFVVEGLVLDELPVVAEEEKAPEVRPLDERPAAARAEEDADVELAALCGGGRIQLQMLLYITQITFLM